MSDPTRGGSSGGKKDRRGKTMLNVEDMSEAQLANEAYGARGAAVRGTAKIVGEAVAKADADSSFVDKAKSRIKKIFD